MQSEFNARYEQKLKSINNTFKQCMEEMQRDYDQHLRHMNEIHSKILENNDQVNNAFAGQAEQLEKEKISIQNER